MHNAPRRQCGCRHRTVGSLRSRSRLRPLSKVRQHWRRRQIRLGCPAAATNVMFDARWRQVPPRMPEWRPTAVLISILRRTPLAHRHWHIPVVFRQASSYGYRAARFRHAGIAPSVAGTFGSPWINAAPKAAVRLVNGSPREYSECADERYSQCAESPTRSTITSGHSLAFRRRKCCGRSRRAGGGTAWRRMSHGNKLFTTVSARVRRDSLADADFAPRPARASPARSLSRRRRDNSSGVEARTSGGTASIGSVRRKDRGAWTGDVGCTEARSRRAGRDIILPRSGWDVHARWRCVDATPERALRHLAVGWQVLRRR